MQALDPLAKILATKLESLQILGESSLQDYAWDEKAYGLHQSSLFLSLSLAQQTTALRYISHRRLSLALCIEEMGLSYCAKMSLLSQSPTEKSAFALMGADETQHYHLILPLLKEPVARDIALNDFVNQAVASSNHLASLFVLQILLEGFGLSYYRSLSETSIDQNIQKVFRRIVADEAFHHGLGVVLFKLENEANHSRYEVGAIDLCEGFLRTIVGELWIAQALGCATKSSLSSLDKSTLIAETAWIESSRNRSRAIEDMVRRHAPVSWVQELERRHVFKS